MKIGFFSETYLPDINGVITSMRSFIQELERAGHEVYVFVPGADLFPAPWKQKRRERHVYRFNSFSYPLYKSIRVAIPFNVPATRAIDRLDLDVVHSHTPFSMGLFAAWVARQHQIPHVHTYHTLYPEYAKFYFPGFKKWNEKGAEKLSAVFCNNATEIIAPSDGIKSKLRSYGIRKPITTLPTGIDREFFGVKGGVAFRRRYKIPAKAPLLITVARLGREKSIDYLMKMFKQVLRSRSDAYYLIVGDGPARLDLQTLAKELGITNRVVFTGLLRQKKDVLAAYDAADVFVFASKTDTQCLTLLEAAATGMPLAARYDRPLMGALKDERNGFFVRGNEKRFAGKVDRLLADKALATRFGKESIRVAKSQSAESRTRELLQVYNRAIATREAEALEPNAFRVATQRVSRAFQRRQ